MKGISIEGIILSISLSLKTGLSLVVLLLLSFDVVSAQNFPTDPAAKLLPDKLGDFRAAGSVAAMPEVFEMDRAKRNGITSWAGRSYVAPDGLRFWANIATTDSDSAAYAQLSVSRRLAESTGGEGQSGDANIGTAGYSLWDGEYNKLTFFKGSVLATVREEGKSTGTKRLTDFAQTLAATLDKGEGDIPVLVKHLPNWHEARRGALYIVSLETLREQFGATSVFSVVDFAGGAEAVTADYDKSKLVIVEFNTPQLATDNDQRISAKLQELRTQGQPVPTAYRRVGNYSVFVFDAPSQEVANALIDQVKYEQMVQWLGENPYRYERALREFTQTTLGVFVNVVKGSGLALVSCLAVGGLIGGLMFRRRRAEQRDAEAYADAGAMLRLNLDELTPETDAARLLGRGK